MDAEPNTKEDQNVEEQVPMKSTNNDEISNQEPVCASPEEETPITESKNAEIWKDSDNTMQSSISRTRAEQAEAELDAVHQA